MLVDFYDCETRSPKVRKAFRMKVLNNRMLSWINEKRVAVRREWA
jgi:hypothetical protein